MERRIFRRLVQCGADGAGRCVELIDLSISVEKRSEQREAVGRAVESLAEQSRQLLVRAPRFVAGNEQLGELGAAGVRLEPRLEGALGEG